MPGMYESREDCVRRHGATLINPERIVLKCNVCGECWSPNIRTGGRLPAKYWLCPNLCNKPQE